MNLNKAIIIGRLTVDPQLKQTQGGQSVATFGVATNRTWTDKNNQKQEEVQFHNIVVWGRQAEITSQFAKKGALIMIEGRIQTRGWQDKTGQERKTTEIIAERVQFGPRASGIGGGMSSQKPNTQETGDRDIPMKEEQLPEIMIDENETEIKAEDIPF